MTAGLYYRVSTDDQMHDSQVEHCRNWCRLNGYEVVEYRDVASGSTTARKGLDKLMEDVRAGKLQAVVCYKLDRLGRSLAHLIQTTAEFKKHGAAFICTSQNIDTRASSPSGVFQMQLLGAVAEFERSLIRERTKAGIDASKERARALGIRWPGGRPLGSGKVADTLPVKEWLLERQRGTSLRSFCRERGISTSSLRRAVGMG